MKTIIRMLAGAACVLASAAAQAAITCSVSSGGFATTYDPATAGNTITPSFFTVTCTKGAAGDPASVAFSVRADNGLYSLGVNNRAAFGANRLRYDVFTNATCGTTWKGGTAISGTVNTPSVGTFTATASYWGCIGPGFAVPAGSYTDTVTMTMTYGAASLTATGSFGVAIYTPPTCSISAAPPNLVFNYTSFGPAVNPSVNFGVTCTTTLPYTMALTTAGGTIRGLVYTVALSTTTSAGTGVQQTHSINGAMAGGQSGTCAVAVCSGTQANAVTVTY